MRDVYHGGEVLAEKDNFILTRPLNSQDMNYHLHDTDTGDDHLIDIGDVMENEEELEEYGGILFSDLLELEDMDMIMETVWKVI